MSLKDQFIRTQKAGVVGRKPRPIHPTGWEPRIDTAAGEAVIRSDKPPMEAKPDWSAWLQEWGFDPDTFTIQDDRVEVRTWDAIIGAGETQRFWYYKARVVKKRPKADMKDLYRRIRGRRPLKRTPPEGDLSYVVLNADWQLGKRDGDGTEGVIRRVLDGADLIADDVEVARREGYQLGQLVVGNLGDIVEGCQGFYPMQTFDVELDRREQMTVAVELMDRQIDRLHPLFERTLIVAVPGNHGENRVDGKAFTSFGDNDDVLAAEMVHRGYRKNRERYGNVRLHVPKNELTVTLDLSGTVVTFAHSHQAGRGSGQWGHVKTLNWWRDQTWGRRGPQDADLLVTGHFHYYAVTQVGDRMHVQVPALDGGSQWYQETKGIPTSQGVVSVVVGGGKVHRVRLLPVT